MLDKKIETILINYFSKSASFEELVKLTEWIGQPGNELVFKDFVKANYLMDASMQDFDTEKEKEKLLNLLNQDKKLVSTRKTRKLLKYAAVFVVLLTLGAILWIDNVPFLKEKTPTPSAANTEVKQPGNKDVLLTLEDGSEMVLEKGKEAQLKNRSINARGIVYEAAQKSKKNTIAFNYLTIPKGGQYFVQLSDGTKIWLNSDTKLKYPINFVSEQPREVELVYGEAYFDVTESEVNNGTSFKVHTGIQAVEVLGTEFNIKAYQDEKDIVTTLVEGKVSVNNASDHRFLKPSEQSVVDNEEGSISVRKVDKIFDEIAWKEGYFAFKKMKMKNIMKVLSRWYDVDYSFENAESENKSFTGVLDRGTTIDQILVYLQKTNEIKFEIDGNTVIIK